MYTPSPVDTQRTPQTPLYKLVAERLGEDPIEFIRARRAGANPMPFARIAEQIREQCNEGRTDEIYVSHEVPRRWLSLGNAAEAAREPEQPEPTT